MSMKQFILLLLPFSIQSMHRQKAHPKSHQRNHAPAYPKPSTYTSTPQKPQPASLESLAKELMYALNLNDIERTSLALQKIKELNKKYEELRCVEIEAQNISYAIVQAMTKKSKTIAQETAKIEMGITSLGHTPHDARNMAATALQKAIQEHAKALTNQELVSNFFSRQISSYHPEECQFNLKAIFDELPL